MQLCARVVGFESRAGLGRRERWTWLGLVGGCVLQQGGRGTAGPGVRTIWGWVDVLLVRRSDVPAIRQLRLSVDAKPVSLGEPLLTAADAAALLSVRPSWIYEAVRDGAGSRACASAGMCASCARTLRTGFARSERPDDHDAHSLLVSRYSAPNAPHCDAADADVPLDHAGFACRSRRTCSPSKALGRSAHAHMSSGASTLTTRGGDDRIHTRER